MAWTGIPGSYAEMAAVPADRLVKLPDGLTFKDGAAAMLQGMTAHYLTCSTYPCEAGRRVPRPRRRRRHGSAPVPDGEDARRDVIATVSTEDKAALAKAAGADHVIIYSKQDFEAEVKRLTGGAGVHVVYDGVGASTFDKVLTVSARAAPWRSTARRVAPFRPSIPDLKARGSLFVTRPSLNHHIARRDELASRAGDVLGWVKDGKVKLRLEHQFPLAEAAAAHRALEGRKTTGKILLLPA